jgi:hypothetical protein
MSIVNYFDISRFRLLLKMELFRSRKALLMTFVIIFGLLFFAGFLFTCVVENKKVFDSHRLYYAVSLMTGGFILSSLAFNDLSSALKRYHYLVLPASTFEKFICMWLLTSVRWIVAFSLTYTLYTLIVNAIGPVLFGRMIFPAFEPFGEFSIKTMRSYFVLQGIFLVGAAHFKGYVLPKTLFALILFLTVCAAIIYFIMKEPFFTDHDCGISGECPLLNEMIKHDVSLFMQWIFWWILAPLCWVAAYLGLKDQEV